MYSKNQILSYLLFIFCGQTAASQTNADTLKILFVGNSYTFYYNMPQLVSVLSDSTDTKLIIRKSTLLVALHSKTIGWVSVG